jgi:hypothetical protein
MLSPNLCKTERNLFMLRMITCQPKTLFFFAAGDIFRTEELALLAPQGMLPLCSKSDRWIRVVRPLAAPHVQFGLFPSGKAVAINSHLAPALSGGCSA